MTGLVPLATYYQIPLAYTPHDIFKLVTRSDTYDVEFFNPVDAISQRHKAHASALRSVGIQWPTSQVVFQRYKRWRRVQVVQVLLP